MTREEIIHKIITYIDLQLDGLMGEIYQDPYSNTFAAYEKLKQGCEA